MATAISEKIRSYLRMHGAPVSETQDSLVRRVVFENTLNTVKGDLSFRLVSDEENLDTSQNFKIEIPDLGEGLRIQKDGKMDIVGLRSHGYEIPRGATFSEAADYAAILSLIESQFPLTASEEHESTD